MTDIRRRDLLKLAPILATTVTAPLSRKVLAQQGDRDEPVERYGTVLARPEESNPLDGKIVVFTTVSPDVDASIRFYRDLIGMALHSDHRLDLLPTSAPGIGKSGRRHALLNLPDYPRSAAVRVLEAPNNAQPNRPRPGSDPRDTGLMTMEGGTKDTALSFHLFKTAGVETISTPRYWHFSAQPTDRDPPRTVHYMTFAAFGPGGEQMFISGNIGGDRPKRDFPGLHGGFYTTTITSLDKQPIADFYQKALGLQLISDDEVFQRNANELIGAPSGTRFTWSYVGRGLNIEVWQIAAKKGTMYPTSLARTGLAMITVRVNDLEKCRKMCDAAGIVPVGEGALPYPGNESPEGFTLRGAAGELVEIVSA